MVRIMGSRSIDEVPVETTPRRDRDGTDLPSVIARIGRRLAWRSPDAGASDAAEQPDAAHVGDPGRAAHDEAHSPHPCDAARLPLVAEVNTSRLGSKPRRVRT